jgi:hypothetical protein
MKVLLYSLLREAAEAIADFQNADLRFESTRYTGVPVVGRSPGKQEKGWVRDIPQEGDYKGPVRA